MKLTEKPDEMLPTRQSLLSRLKNWDDHESWRDFFDTYWRLIYEAGRKAGLNDAEAQDAVQETVISVLKKMPEFKYDSQKGSFKSWLLRLTGWRIIDQFRKRQKPPKIEEDGSLTGLRSLRMEEIIDPAGLKLEAIWDQEWEGNLMAAAMERVKRKIDPKEFQIFDLYVVRQKPVLQVAEILNVNPGAVYLAKHRVSKLLKKEIERLTKDPI